MIPNRLYIMFGVIFGKRSIDIGNGRSIVWTVGEAALRHFGPAARIPLGINDNERSPA